MAKHEHNYKANNNLYNMINSLAETKGQYIEIVEQEIADYTGLKAKTIRKYKYHELTPSLPVALKICEYFKCRAEDLYKLQEIV